MSRWVKYLAVVVLLLVVQGEASAQKMKERGWVRSGNRQYEKANYDKSIEHYTEALRHDPTSFEAQYDLASALYRTERYDEAEKILASIVNNESRSEIERGEVAYNLGNTQFAQQKYQDALASYRFAMRCNPNDEDAKFNYTLTKRMLQQQQQNQDKQNQDKQNQDKKEEQKDQQQNKEQQGDKDKEQKDQPKGEEQRDNKNQDQQQTQEKKGDKKEGENGKEAKSAMTPEQQEAILQAIQAEEDKTQDKLKEGAGVVIHGGKNW